VFRDAIADRVGVAQAFAFNDLYWLRARSRSFTASYDEFQWRLQELSLRAEPKQLSFQTCESLKRAYPRYLPGSEIANRRTIIVGSPRRAKVRGNSVLFVLLSPFPTFAPLVLGAAVAGDAVLEALDAFCQVLCTDIGRRVFVTSVTRVASEVAIGMTGHARGRVVAIEYEEAVVIERRWLPSSRAMTAGATVETAFGELPGMNIFVAARAVLGSVTE